MKARGELVNLRYYEGPVWVYGHGLNPVEACSAAAGWFIEEDQLEEDEEPELEVGEETYARWQWQGADDYCDDYGDESVRVCVETRRGRGAFPVTEVWRARDLEHLRENRHFDKMEASRARAAIRLWWPEVLVERSYRGVAFVRAPGLSGMIRVDASWSSPLASLSVEYRDHDAFERHSPPGRPISWRFSPRSSTTGERL